MTAADGIHPIKHWRILGSDVLKRNQEKGCERGTLSFGGKKIIYFVRLFWPHGVN
jgi:hypothetical protein